MVFSVETFSSISNIHDFFSNPLTKCFFFLLFRFFFFLLIFLFLFLVLYFSLDLLSDITNFLIDLAIRPISVFFLFEFSVFSGLLDLLLLEVMDHIDLIFFEFRWEVVLIIFFFLLVFDFDNCWSRFISLLLI